MRAQAAVATGSVSVARWPNQGSLGASHRSRQPLVEVRETALPGPPRRTLRPRAALPRRIPRTTPPAVGSRPNVNQVRPVLDVLVPSVGEVVCENVARNSGYEEEPRASPSNNEANRLMAATATTPPGRTTRRASRSAVRRSVPTAGGTRARARARRHGPDRAPAALGHHRPLRSHNHHRLELACAAATWRGVTSTMCTEKPPRQPSGVHAVAPPKRRGSTPARAAGIAGAVPACAATRAARVPAPTVPFTDRFVCCTTASETVVHRRHEGEDRRRSAIGP